MKQDIPVVGIDDGGFQIHSWSETYVFAVFMRGGRYIENICQKKIELDSSNPSHHIVDLLESCPQTRNLKYIFHKGVTVGGLGVIDPFHIFQKFHVPIILIQERIVDKMSLLETVQKKFGDTEAVERIRRLPSQKYDPQSHLYFQAIGVEEEEVIAAISRSRNSSKIPECLRVAHLIGKSYYSSVK